MRKIFKQVLKAICYVLVFFGIQVLVSSVAQFAYGFNLGKSGITSITEEELTLLLTEYLYENMAVISAISGVITIIFLLIYFKIRKKSLWVESSLTKVGTNKIIPIILLAVASVLFISNIMELLPIPEEILMEYAMMSMSLSAGAPIISIIATVIVAPLVEEIVFRGLVFSRLKKAMPVWVAIVVSSVLFGIMHGQILWIIYATVLGVIMCLVAENSKSIGASIIFHMVFNLIGVYMGELSLTSGMMLAIVIVSLVLGAGAMRVLLKNTKDNVVVES